MTPQFGSFLSPSMKNAVNRSTGILTPVALLLSLGAIGACGPKKETTTLVGTAVVGRETIVVDAQATGSVEPINVIEVKSKASGLITRMPVETGSQVNVGDLLVQVDTRDVKNQFDQSQADQRSAKANLEVAQAQKTRSDELFKTRIITTQEYENAQLALTQAQGQMIRANANLDLAQQRMDDATVVAPVAGTIIEKPVALGQVITSATGAFGGGTTLLKMADLSKVRVRALVNETDIGKVRPGQPARVTVDAYPDRPFQGVVEKIEPQAVVQQSVTMFPVIVSLENNEGFLKPGMNGEVSMLIDRRENVIAVSNDAVRTLREAPTAATFVGLNPDSVSSMVAAMQAQMRGAGGAGGRGQPTADTPTTQAVAMGAGDAPSAGNPGSSGRSGNSASRGARGNGDAAGGVNARTPGRNGQSGGADRNAGSGGRGASGGAGPIAGRTPGATRARSGVVFVEVAPSQFEPRLVSLGASNYDYSEVLSGLKEGETVATLAVAALQAKRDQQNDRFRQNTTVPGVQRQTTTPAPAGGGGGRPPGGGR